MAKNNPVLCSFVVFPLPNKVHLFALLCENCGQWLPVGFSL